MSKKRKFRKKHMNIIEKSSQNAEKEIKTEEEKSEYNTKSDFVSLAVIILFFTGILVGLYYYDKQSGVLEQLVSLM